MKKILIGIISLLTVIIFFCAGCGAYVQNGSSSNDDDKVIVQPKPGDDGQKEEKFTVELRRGSSKYIAPYTPGKTLKARWSAIDGSSIHEAAFNDDGIAEIDGLDGDYKVTLVDLPDDVTYDPQGYSADNNNKHTVIDILSINRTNHSTGSGLLDGITTVSTGTYRAIIDSPWNGALNQYSEVFEGIVFYQFAPKQAGWYSVESFIDITSNDVNPILEHYFSSTQFKNWNTRMDSGGSASTYSKNFRFEIELDKNDIGNVWAFGIHAESKKGTYPIQIDFTIKYEGEYVAPVPDYVKVETNGPYGDPGETPAGTFRYNYKDTNNMLRGSRFKLNPDDGFYYLYDEINYAKNNGFGPKLYAKINQKNEVLILSHGFVTNFDGDDDDGSISLAIEFRDPFDYNRFIYKDYSNFIETYDKYCNTDGVHPVNEELKQFLQDWAVQGEYFRDGNGWAEIGVGLASSYGDQWLFACGYYI